MQLKSNERWINYFRLLLHYKPKNHPPGVKFDLEKISDLFITRYNNDPSRFSKTYSNGKEWLYIAKAQKEHGNLYLLLHQADKDGADPAFINVTNHQIRQEEKHTDEGNGFSAHVAISLTPNHGGNAFNRYTMLVEVVPGLSRARLRSFLNFCFSDLVQTDNKDEAGKNIRYRPNIDVYRDSAENLKQRLENGILSEVQFIEETETGLDDFTKSQKKKLVFSVKNTDRLNVDVLKWIKGKISENEGYDKLLITTKDSNGKIESEAAENFYGQDVAEILFSRHHKVSLSSPVKSCEESWVKEIKDRMTSLLN